VTFSTVSKLYDLGATLVDAQPGMAPIVMWSIIECCVGIVAGSLATMRPLLRYLVRGSLSSRSTEPNAGHKMHTFKGDKRLVSKIGSSYRVIVEADGRKHEEDDTSDGGSQRKILPESAPGGMQIFKESVIEVRNEDKGGGDGHASEVPLERV
jgi:hypothetical protein